MRLAESIGFPDEMLDAQTIACLIIELSVFAGVYERWLYCNSNKSAVVQQS